MEACITCKNRALGSWCNLKSCTGTDLCSQPFQWHPDCSIFYYLRTRRKGNEKYNWVSMSANWVRGTMKAPFIVTLTPDARNNPPKRLLKIWLPSRVAVAWLVISIPRHEYKKPLIPFVMPWLVSLDKYVRLRKRPTSSKAIKDPVLPQHRVTVGADQHSCLRISEDVVFLQQT